MFILARNVNTNGINILWKLETNRRCTQKCDRFLSAILVWDPTFSISWPPSRSGLRIPLSRKINLSVESHRFDPPLRVFWLVPEGGIKPMGMAVTWIIALWGLKTLQNSRFCPKMSVIAKIFASGGQNYVFPKGPRFWDLVRRGGQTYGIPLIARDQVG